jgi:sugar transferase (PEP-CTERM/EpsH1 system associated)
VHIAFLTPTLPWPADNGGALRTYHLLRALAQRHTVDLLCFHYGAAPQPGPLTELCRTVALFSLGDHYSRRRQLVDLLGRRPCSVAYFSTPTTGRQVAAALNRAYDLLVSDEVIPAPYALAHRRRTHVPILLNRPKIDHRHYQEMANGRSWGAAKVLDWLESRRLQRFERAVLPAVQHAVVCSDDDGTLTKRFAPALPQTVLPNGADVNYFQLRDRACVISPPTILLLGTMHYYPNIDAVMLFFKAIYPTLRTNYPDLQVLIVGHQPPPAIVALGKQPGVTVTGSVPDIRPYLARSSLLAVPLRLGGGTRLKIAEALAAGVPVVSTPIGAQGLAVEHGRHLLLAETPTAFAAAIQQLLAAPSYGQQLAKAGRQLVESQYSWAALGAQFVAACEATVAESRSNQE